MVMPVPGHSIATDYGKKNSRLWPTCGYHTGIDLPAPVGTKVVAARPGITVHVNYGSAFGSHQLAVKCSDGSLDFYAHMSARVGHGVHVNAGDKVGEVGGEGHVTGPHLHFERHKTANGWRCSNIANPHASVDWQPQGTAGAAPQRHGGHYLQGGKVYASKMHLGQMDSDSVKNVQIALRNHDPRITLPVTGNYLDTTKAEVEKFQRARGWRGAQADGIVGPSTAGALELVWIDDTD
jgi:hypothetical protein